MGLPNELHPLQLAASSGGYEIEQSLRFNSADSHYLSRTHSASNQRLWTWSGWVKRGKLASGYLFYTRWSAGSSQGGIFFAGDTLRYFARVSGSDKAELYTTSVFRDPSAWYHVVAVLDAANTSFKFYVNNVEQPLTTLTSVQNADHAINHPEEHNLGNEPTQSGYFDGYMSEVHFVDGAALTPTDFGEYDDNGVWRPINVSGLTYGTNGFYLNFSNSSSLGEDQAGSNDWTANNFTTSGTGTDVMSDTPTKNYATLNSVIRPYTVTSVEALSEGNLKVRNTGSGVTGSGWGTFTLTSGKWYYEATVTEAGGNIWIGWSNDADFAGRGTPAAAGRDYGYTYKKDGNKCNNSATGTSYGATYTTNDVIGAAIDIDGGTITFYKNGTSQGTAFTSVTANGGFSPVVSIDPGTTSVVVNFGQRAFEQTVPSGYKAINTSNLLAPTIKDGSDYFNTVLWTGNSTDDRNITVADNSGNTWQPDLVWIKARITSFLHQHELYDAVRGATKRLQSNDTAAEDTAANNMQAFNSDGFQIGTAGSVNASSDGYVAWNWLEGATQGFDIVTGTGGTAVNHNLGVAPDFVIFKYRDAVSDWNVYHKNATSTSQRLKLNSTAAVESIAASWTINSTNFAYGGGSNTWVAYLFAEVEGYSKFGSYTGNGSTDGPFVATSFAPAWILLKRTDTTGNWILLDNRRYGYNSSVSPRELYANLTNAEADSNAADFLSNGFKLRVTFGSYNASGGTYIFAAFAENPFGGSSVSPATAR